MSRIKAQLFAAGYKPCQLAEHLAWIYWRLTAPHTSITHICMPYTDLILSTLIIFLITKGDRGVKLQMEMELEMDGLVEIGYGLLVNGFLFNHKSQHICQRRRRQGMEGRKE